MTTLLIILSIICIFLFVISLNLFKRVETYEQLLESYEDYMLGITELVDEANKTIQQVDANGHFSSDDEVGFFFEALKAIQTALNEFSVKNMTSEN